MQTKLLKSAGGFITTEMPNTFYFHDNKEYPFNVSNETLLQTPATFQNVPTNKYHEKKVLSMFFSLVKPTEEVTIADIGAQSGLYSLYAKYLPNAKFVSFEPIPYLQRLLLQNLALNNITNVELIQKAVSRDCGPRQISLCTNHNGLHTLAEHPLRFRNVRKLDIVTTTLDSEFADVGRNVDYMKIDTEGGEFDIILGGKKTLETYKPTIMLEVNEENLGGFNKTPNDLFALLEACSYKLIGQFGLEEYVFSHESKVESMKMRIAGMQ